MEEQVSIHSMAGSRFRHIFSAIFCKTGVKWAEIMVKKQNSMDFSKFRSISAHFRREFYKKCLNFFRNAVRFYKFSSFGAFFE